MFLRPTSESKFDQDLDFIYKKTQEVMDAFFAGKIPLLEIYTGDDYNSFYYKLRDNNNPIYSVSVHYKDYDTPRWVPSNCFYLTVSFWVDNDNFYYYDYYFDEKDEQLMKRLLGKAARDSVKYFNSWAKNVQFLTKGEQIDYLKEDYNPNKTNDTKVKNDRNKVLNLLNKGLKDFRYEDFIK